MAIGDIENKVDETLNRSRVLDAVEIGPNKPTRDHKLRHTRKLIGIPITTLALYVGALIVGASLVTLLFSTYYIQVQGNIDMDGIIQENFMEYDGIPLLGETTEVTTMDIPSLAAGNTFTEVHNFNNLDGHNWVVSFDTSGMPDMITPSALWYGVTFEVREHGTTTPITDFTLKSGDVTDVDYYYAVDPLFAQPNPDIDFPFDLMINFDEYINHLPVATDDSAQVTQGGSVDVHVLTNDVDPDGNPLEITSINIIEGGNNGWTCTIVGTAPNQYLHVTCGTAGLFSADYVIDDGFDGTDTGHLSVSPI